LLAQPAGTSFFPPQTRGRRTPSNSCSFEYERPGDRERKTEREKEQWRGLTKSAIRRIGRIMKKEKKSKEDHAFFLQQRSCYYVIMLAS